MQTTHTLTDPLPKINLEPLIEKGLCPLREPKLNDHSPDIVTVMVQNYDTEDTIDIVPGVQTGSAWVDKELMKSPEIASS